MGLFSKPQGHLGVDIGAHGIKLVELHEKKGRPQLWTYGIADQAIDIHIPNHAPKTPQELRNGDTTTTMPQTEMAAIDAKNDPRIDRYADALKTLCKEANVQAKAATASIPVSYVFHAVVTLPQAEKKEIARMAKAEVTKVLPQPIEQMQVVHQSIAQTDEEKKKKHQRVLVTAAPKNLVAFYSAIFQKAGLELVALETEAFALERSLVGRDPATVMIVDIGAERSNFFIVDQGLPMTHRSIQVGGKRMTRQLASTLGVEDALAHDAKFVLARMQAGDVPADLFDDVLDPIKKEMKYGFDLFLGQSGNAGKRPEKIILTGGSSVYPFFADRLSDSFQMKTFIGDPWARVVYQQPLKRVLDRIGPRMSVGIGLALRKLL